MRLHWLAAASLGALASLIAAESQAATFTPTDGQALSAATTGDTGAQLVAREPMQIIFVPQGAAAVAAVPEPASWAMMLVGFGGLGAILRRRRQAAAA
jgi:hypothetical protein